MGIAGNMLRVRTINRIGKTFGFNLIELLVSLVVVAVSLFAVAKIQIFGLQAGEGSKQSTASTVSVVNLMERLSGHRQGISKLLKTSSDGYIKFTLDNVEAMNMSDSDCSKVPLADEYRNKNSAETGIKCEIDAWIYSVWNSLNLEGKKDICANILITSVDDYEYKTGEKFDVPRVAVEYKWRKTPSSAAAKMRCTLNDKNRLKPPKFSTNADEDETAEIGFSSMEYLLP